MSKLTPNWFYEIDSCIYYIRVEVNDRTLKPITIRYYPGCKKVLWYRTLVATREGAFIRFASGGCTIKYYGLVMYGF